MPTIRSFGAVLVAASFALSTPAFAGEMDAKSQSKHIKTLAKQLKTVGKLSGKFDKAAVKGKGTAKVDAKLDPIVINEIAWLKAEGYPPAEMEEGEEAKSTWKSRYFDALVVLRDGKATVAKQEAFKQIQKSMQTRLDRQQRKLDKMSM